MNQKRKAVVWDIDDVLTPTSVTFFESAVRTHGQCLHPDHWSDYLWGQHVGMDEGIETQQYLIDQRIIETSQPYDYTEQALQITKEHGLVNVLLSARAWHPAPHSATQEWLARYVLDPYVDDMHFVKVEEPKLTVLEKLTEIYDIQAFVEDNPAHAVAALTIVPKVYLVRRSWNNHCADNTRLNCVSTSLDAALEIRNLNA